MLLEEKIRKMQNKLEMYQAACKAYPDIKVEEFLINPDQEYLVSKTVAQTSDDVEFAGGGGTIDNSIHHAYIYTDMKYDTKTIRIYGDVGLQNGWWIKLFISLDKKLNCHDYQNAMKSAGATHTAIRKVDAYVVNFIKETECQINMSKLPENIKGLMAFL